MLNQPCQLQELEGTYSRATVHTVTTSRGSNQPLTSLRGRE